MLTGIARHARIKGLRLEWKRYVGDGVSCLVLLAAALPIGCFDLYGSGTLWPDGPRYANAGVMIHNWILSDDLLHPYRFAQSQYAQDPGFNLPFHPPVYPFLLALFFLAAGVSYASARVFVALCLWVSVYFFYAILRRMGTTRLVALGCSLVLLTMPEVLHWSRDTMSEVPALAFLLAGSYFFLRWVESHRFVHCFVAFALAEAAFLSRVTTAVVIAVWFLFILLTARSRERKLPKLHLLPLTAAYVLFNAGWVVFVSRFSKYETGLGGGSSVADKLHLPPWQSVSYYLLNLPRMAGWGTLVIAGLGLVCALMLWRREVKGVYWVSWLVASYAFLLTLGLVPEKRYFFYVLPGLPGLAAVLSNEHLSKTVRAWVAPSLLGLCLASNLIYLKDIPRGVVGYEAVARQLARASAHGNIMSVSWATPDFVFRYQAGKPNAERRVIRGDRTLAVSLGNYGGFSGGVKTEPTILAHNSQEVLDIMRRGRVRYLITCAPDDTRRDERTREMVLAHEVAQTLPESFALRGKFPLVLNYVSDLRGVEPLNAQVYVWEFLEELPSTPSELPVVVPTADLVLD